jgi:alpha-mannosidase II
MLESKASNNAKYLQELEQIYKHLDDLNTANNNNNNNNKKVPQEFIEKKRNEMGRLIDKLKVIDRQKAGANENNHRNIPAPDLELPKQKPAVVEQQQKKPDTLDRIKQAAEDVADTLASYFKPGKVYQKQCEWLGEQKPLSSDIEVANLIEQLPFDDLDGGVWKQGFNIDYDPAQWSQSKKLRVIITPHSHNDPGWLMTFEEYFHQRTKGILDTIVNSLSEKPTRKFIWAEMSYLSLWWKQASEEMKTKMRKLIVETKQLEIVTGGWVMTDEANSHYYAMIEEMVEGHEWLQANVHESIRPTYGWSIDPFGYTPTMAYLLKQMGFDGMLIQRVHYHLKKYMAKARDFEFKWRQSWSTANSKDTSILTHVMPFYSYDVPHTCGPDPKICCQFDFKRMPGSQMSCPWGVQPQAITDANVKQRAELLLDQYRKKSQLYGDEYNHNVLFVPLGDDFRWMDMDEAHAQFENYERLMDYMNADREMNVDIRWGTLRDYFELLVSSNRATDKQVKTFSGDFFTYADRNDHYWSGYYTSRPQNKRLDRILEHYLRSAEVLFSLANLHEAKPESSKRVNVNDLYKRLLTARRNLAIFQHHDGITGTSKTPVVYDYATKYALFFFIFLVHGDTCFRLI